MNTTTTTWPGSDVIQCAIARPTAMRLARTEYQRVSDAVYALGARDWTRPTDCPAWDVRQLVAHIASISMLDRLLHHCHVVVTDGDRYRMKQARSRGGHKINNR